MKSIWRMIREHPFVTVAIGFVGVTPFHTGFVANKDTDPVIAALCNAGMWGCGTLVLIGLAALLSPSGQQPKKGRCPTCGYDLRATPERCPECGTEVKPPMDAGERR